MPLHLQRQREIVEILARNGFGLLAATIGLPGAQARASRTRFPGLRPDEEPSPAEVDAAWRSPAVVRRTLEQLGPTFIKMGQILSTRADLVPPAYQTELAELQSNAPWLPFADVRSVVEGELGAPLETLFASFATEPLGSASIGVVHAATLRDGSEVVVKVQRPQIVPVIMADIDILRMFVARLGRHWHVIGDYDVPGFIDDFERQLRHELDYLREARNAGRIAGHFAGRSGLRVPMIHADLTTTRVLTMERLRGVPVDDLEGLDAAGVDRRAVGQAAARAVLDMVLVDGFFHADPHPGNILVQADGTLALLDFGMVGSLTDAVRRRLVAAVAAFTARDEARLTEAVLDLAPPRGHVDRTLLTAAMARLLDAYADRPLKEIPAVEVALEVLNIVRRFRMVPPPGLPLVVKMLAMVEGLGRVLDPDFDFFTLLKPYVVKMVRSRLDPETLLHELAAAATQAAEFGIGVPEQLRRILTRYEREGVRLGIDDAEVEPYVLRLEALGDRVVAGLLVSALINAVGALGATDQRWLARTRGPLLVAGTTLGGVLGAYLANSLRRRH